ncbi:MAG: nucleoside deaminase [Alphaproteobacteria bacterium]|nr:nucleoside deaminase [Alphaproteobacteria bacterium]
MNALSPFTTLLSLAKKAAQKGEVPIAAAIVDNAGNLISMAHNRVEKRKDATQHAELIAIRLACKARGEKYLEDCDLYVTLEPCAMCAQAISLAKIRRVYFGAYDAKGGGVEHGARVFSHPQCHHAPEVIGGVMENECGQLLSDFFAAKRNQS